MQGFLRVPAIVTTVVGVILVNQPAGAANDAAQFIESLGRDALEVLRNPDVSDEQRRERYRELLEQGFAVKTIARFVLGRYWRGATPEQREEYLTLFREFVLETYADRLNNYAGETFEIVKTQPIDDKDTLVGTEIHSPDGPPIRVDYRVRQRDGRQQIVDVVVEGVSLVITQRSEFASVINREGIDGLLTHLRRFDAKDDVQSN